MLRRTLVFALGMVFGAFAMYGGLRYHIVRSKENWHIVSKTEANLNEIYTDIRGFDLEDWSDHPQLMNAILRSEEPALMDEIQDGLYRQTGRQILDGIIH